MELTLTSKYGAVWYRMLASRNRSPEPDLTAAFTIANFYHLGLRGVKQDLRLALKYYEICGDYNHWEGGGLAGLFHVWGIGMRPEERDLGKALSYFQQGTPGGIEGCLNRMKQVGEGCVFVISLYVVSDHALLNI